MIFGTAIATDAQGRGFYARDSFRGACMDIPNLTDSQKEKINSLNESHRKSMDEMREKVREAEDIITANELRSEMALERNKHLKDLSALLDKEQKEWFDENVISNNNNRGRDIQARGERGPGFRAERPGRGHGRMHHRDIHRGPRGGRGMN